VRVQARNEVGAGLGDANASLQKGLDTAKGKLNQFAESSKKILGQLGVGGAAADAVGGLGGLAGVGSLGALGIGGLAGIGTLELVKWSTGLREFQAEFKKLTEEVVRTAEKLREALSVAAGGALETRNLDQLRQVLRTAERSYKNDLAAFNETNAKLAQARQDQTAVGRQVSRLAGTPTEVEQLTEVLETQRKVMESSGKAFEDARASMEKFKKTQKETTDETSKAIAAAKELEQKKLTGIADDARERITTAGLSQLEREIRELRRSFPLERLQSMQLPERNRIEDELRMAEAALREADRIRGLPQATARAFRDAFGSKGEPAPVDVAAQLSGSLGAFQSGGFRQVLGGTGGESAVTKRFQSDTVVLLKKINTTIERSVGVFR
jgi:hypothetical protein